MSKKRIEQNAFSIEEQLRYALAFESNMAEFAIALTEAAGGQLWREKDFTLVLPPFAHALSGVFLPRFDENTLTERIGMILEIARKQRKKILFRLGPAPKPAYLAEKLVEMGVHKSLTQKYMAIPLTDNSPMLSQPVHAASVTGLKIYPVDDYGILSTKIHPRLGAINSAKKRELVQAYQKLADQTPRRHWMFLAELEGKLVASVGLFLHQENVAGHDLLVLPEYRRQGIGTAMLREIALFMIERGASLGVLASSVMGTQFYPRLGIVHIGMYPIYSYKP